MADPMCKAVRQKLVDFIEQELPASEEESVREHVKGCSACQVELSRLKETLQRVQQAQVTPPSSAFWANYLVRVRQKIERGRGRLWPSRIIPAIGLGAALVLMVALFSRQPKIVSTAQQDVRPDLEQVALSMDDADYLYLVDVLDDSVDVLQIITKELASEDVRTFSEYALWSPDMEWIDLWEPLESAMEDYLIEASEVEVLIQEMEDQDQSSLLEHIQHVSTG